MNIAVITGASAGIGRELVYAVDKDARYDEIWVIARRKERLEELRDKCTNPIRPIALDLSDLSSIDAYQALLEQEQPEIKMLVNAAGCDLVGHAGHGVAGRVLCRVGHAARDAGAAVVLKPGLSAYTPFIGGDVHEALESLFVRGGIPAADGGEDDRPGDGRRCARGAAAGHQRRR